MGARQQGFDADPTRRRWAPLAVGAAAAVIVLGGAAAVVAVRGFSSSGVSHTSLPASVRRSAPAARPDGRRRPASPPVPLRVESVSPARGAQGVPFSSAVTIQLSASLAPTSPLPSLSPAVPGAWSKAGDELVFRPNPGFSPFTTVHLTIPGGPAGVREAGGGTLSTTVTSSFTVAGGSVLRLQQLLAELGYLPVTFVASGTSPGPAIDAEPTAPGEVDPSPVPGRFEWRYQDTPASLEQLWSPDRYTVVTRGAVMAFESAAGLGVDGDAGRLVWRALLQAVARRQLDPAPYAYIRVSEKLPESLTVWAAGRDVLSFPANTGIPQAPTAQGTFTVYARYLTTTMSGRNPDGSKYSDPGIPWVAYFNGGDAIHGFWRPGYGYPQSLGCVELVPADAEQVWPYDQLGTLVTVD